MKPSMRALAIVGWSLPLALAGCAWIKPQSTGTAPNAPPPAAALPPARASVPPPAQTSAPAPAPSAAQSAAPSAASPEQTASASTATAAAASGATSTKAKKPADAAAAAPRAQSAPSSSAAAASARKPPPAAQASATPAPSTAAAAQTLNLADLEQRLKDTRAIGVFTKLSLKNQVDDLLAAFRDVYRGPDKHLPAELRQRYDQLLLKVLDLLRNGDPPLAQAIASSREAIWNILADPDKFEKI